LSAAAKHFKHALHRQQPVEPGRSDIDLGGQLLDQRQHRVERGAVDAQRPGGVVTRDDQAGRDRAAFQRFGQAAAQLQFQPLIAGGQAETQIERLGIEAFQLPHPTDALFVAFGTRKSGHAGDGHGGAILPKRQAGPL
jgi:hypothetical protein